MGRCCWGVCPLACFLAVIALSCPSFAEESTIAIPVLSLQDVSVAINAADGSSVTANSGAPPTVLLLNPEVPPKHQLEVSTTVLKDGVAFKPQQLFLMLKHKVSGLTTYAVAKHAKDGGATLTMSAVLLDKQVGKQAGAYDVTLLAGDPAVPGAIRYYLGTVDFVIPEAPSAGTPMVKTAVLQPISNTKPAIVHQHRPPVKTPPASVSLVFAGLAFVPLVGVIGAILFVVKPNFKAWPTDTVTQLSALAFHGSLAAMLGLYLLFWLKLNLAETLPLAFGGGAVVALTGYKLLSGLASARLKDAKGKAKKE